MRLNGDQEVTVLVKLRDGTVQNVNGNPPPCKLDDLECQRTSLDPYAYIWDHPDNCVLSVLKEEQVNMIKNEHRYHMVSIHFKIHVPSEELPPEIL